MKRLLLSALLLGSATSLSGVATGAEPPSPRRRPSFLAAGAVRCTDGQCLSGCRAHATQHSDHPFYGKGQEAVLAGRFFCGVGPFFALQKNQKNRRVVQKLFRFRDLDTWANETKHVFQPVRDGGVRSVLLANLVERHVELVARGTPRFLDRGRVGRAGPASDLRRAPGR